jgi:hypothetical protein
MSILAEIVGVRRERQRPPIDDRRESHIVSEPQAREAHEGYWQRAPWQGWAGPQLACAGAKPSATDNAKAMMKSLRMTISGEVATLAYDLRRSRA